MPSSSAKPAKSAKGSIYKDRIGDEALAQRTGKNWAQWFAVLEKAGAKKMAHTEIARHLHETQNVPGWWCQMIAVGYEQAHGMRKQYEGCSGTFNANCSRTFDAGISALYRAFADDKARASWLAGDRLEISTARSNKNVRGAWNKSSRVEFRFTPKGASKTQIAVDHMNLASSAEVAKMKAFWAKNLERLREKFSA